MPYEPCIILIRANTQNNNLKKCTTIVFLMNDYHFLVNSNPNHNPNHNPNPNQQPILYNYFSWIMHNIWKIFILSLKCFYIAQFEYAFTHRGTKLYVIRNDYWFKTKHNLIWNGKPFDSKWKTIWFETIKILKILPPVTNQKEVSWGKYLNNLSYLWNVFNIAQFEYAFNHRGTKLYVIRNDYLFKTKHNLIWNWEPFDSKWKTIWFETIKLLQILPPVYESKIIFMR